MVKLYKKYFLSYCPLQIWTLKASYKDISGILGGPKYIPPLLTDSR